MALLGFRRIKSSGGGGGGRRRSGGSGGGGDGAPNFTDAQVVSLIMKNLGKNPSQEQMAQAYQALGAITGKGQPEAQIAMVELQAKARDLATEQNDTRFSVDTFDTTLQQNLNKRASSSYSDPYVLSSSYAEEYSAASEQVDAKIDDLISNGRGSAEAIKALREKKKAYEEKAIFYGNLQASYYSRDSEGKLGPSVDTEYAYVPQINPATGKISSVEIMKVADLDEKKFMATDTPVRTAGGQGKPIKLYLPVTQVDETPDGKPIMGARFGRLTYRQDVRATNKDGTAFKALPSLIAETKNEDWSADQETKQFNATVKDARENGIVLNDSNRFGFDSSDPGTNKLIRTGSKWLYKNDAGQLMEVEGDDSPSYDFIGPKRQTKQEMLVNYLKASGKSQRDIDVVLSQPHWVGSDILRDINPDNNINEGFLQKGLPSIPGITALPQRPTSAVGSAGLAAGQAIGAVSKFFSAKPEPAPAIEQPAPAGPSAPNKPNAAPESSGGVKSTGDIIAKGAKFFGSLLK